MCVPKANTHAYIGNYSCKFVVVTRLVSSLLLAECPNYRPPPPPLQRGLLVNRWRTGGRRFVLISSRAERRAELLMQLLSSFAANAIDVACVCVNSPQNTQVHVGRQLCACVGQCVFRTGGALCMNNVSSANA